MKTPCWLRLNRVLSLVLLLPLLAGAADQALPLDPAVRSGRLPNGLSYYVRKNAKPEKRVELRLAVNTGSVQEDDDQLGLAHLVEHMCFKGTKSFPKAELIHYLQSVGSNFGPDINGYTSFDETVYMLTLPTDKPDILTNGFKIMKEWASAVNFDAADIDLERKVVVEEWRLGRGAQQRMLDKILPVVFKDSKYAHRLPIGTKESLERMSHDTIRRFYNDWYRPDLMAFIVVGDIDPAAVEETIKTVFGAIPARERPRAKETYQVPDNEAPLYSIVSDRENPYNMVTLAFKTEAPRYGTVSAYRRYLTEQLFVQLLNLRLQELTQEAKPPFVFAASAFGNMWIRTKGAYQLFCVVPEGGVERGLTTLLTENERVRQHGFSAAELERAKKSVLRALEQAYLDREKTESSRLVHAYLSHFLSESPAPGIEFQYDFAKTHLPGITLAEVNDLPRQWITPVNRVMFVQSVEKPEVKLPTEAELQSVVDQVASAKIEPRQEKQLAASLIEKKPAPRKIAKRTEMPEIGVTELTLENGLRVVLKPSDFKNDEIVFSAYRPGGRSVLPDDHDFSAQVANGYLVESGVANFTAPDLQKMLSGKTVNVRPSVSLYYDRVDGTCSAKDLETALQLTHLHFTAPRLDPVVVDSLVARQKSVLQNLRLHPRASFSDEVQRARYNGHRRTENVLPTDDDWASVNFNKVWNVVCDRFLDATGFTFVFAGAFTVEQITPLIETYIGSLPASKPSVAWKDVGLRSVEGPLQRDIRRGMDPQSIVVLNIGTPCEYSRDEGHVVWSLGNILQRALIDKLRLELGGVYNVSAHGGMGRVPVPRVEFDIAIPCSPDNVQKLLEATEAEMARMQRDGLRPDEIQKEVEAQRRMFERDQRDNGSWCGRLEVIYREQEPSFMRVANPQELVALLTPEQLQAAARKYLDASKSLRFVMYPQEKVAGN